MLPEDPIRVIISVSSTNRPGRSPRARGLPFFLGPPLVAAEAGPRDPRITAGRRPKQEGKAIRGSLQ